MYGSFDLIYKKRVDVKQFILHDGKNSVIPGVEVLRKGRRDRQ